MLDKLYYGWRLVFIFGTFVLGSILYLVPLVWIVAFETFNYLCFEKSVYAGFPLTLAFFRDWLRYLLWSWAAGTLTGLFIHLTKDRSLR
jgi:hypothetical protein